MTDDRLALIQSYVDRGWAPVPIPSRSKNPGFDGWERYTVGPDGVEPAFPVSRNVGLILGDRSNGLVDIDLDSPEAIALAPVFLPATAMMHGNAAKPRSHWWYRCDPAPDTRRFRDIDGAALVEVRSSGAQTIVPPSIHPDGYPIVWESFEDPAAEDGRVLADAVARLAACVLLARNWPSQGSRHDLALAVAGALLRHGWDIETVDGFVGAVTRLSRDPEPIDRQRAIRDTARNLAAGKACTGIPTMVDILGQRIVDRFCDWLGIASVADAGRLVLRPAIEERKPWKAILDEVVIPVGALPERLAAWVNYAKQYTPMFPDDWPITMALAFWSSLWPGVRIQNLNLAIWTLGVNKAGAGKNTATEELRSIIKQCTTMTGQQMSLYTTGSPEGIWEGLAGVDKQMLCYHEEFGGFLKLLQREHMSYAREALCSLYDGRAVAHRRAQKSGVEIYNPHVTVVATINQEELVAHSSRQDLTSGYLSRFLVCAPNATDTLSDDFPFEHDPQRVRLVEETARYLMDYRQIKRVEYLETGRRDPPLLLQYRAHLGIGTGRVIDLDRLDEEPAFPASRIFARVKKTAALLALAERRPTLGDAHEVVMIHPEHIVLAIDIIERSRAYGQRMADWIGQSPDVELSNRVLQRLSQRPDGMSQRELCNSLRERARDIQGSLELLESDGRAHAGKAGRVVRWFAGPLPANGVAMTNGHGNADELHAVSAEVYAGKKAGFR